MTKPSVEGLGSLQGAVMEAIWEAGEATVHDVRRQLGQDKKLAYTTVLSAMQKLEKAGWLGHRAEGRSYVYFPTRSRLDAGRGALKRFVQRAFGGNAMLLFEQLLEDQDLTDDELRRLRRLVELKRKEPSHE